jgi:hypothetical protein
MMSALLMYLVGSISATIVGLMFYLAVQNLDPSTDPGTRGKTIMASLLLSVLFTPLGAWFITAVIRMRKSPTAS